MKTEANNNQGKEKQKGKWPWWGQLILAVISLAVVTILVVGLPVWNATRYAQTGADPVDVWIPMLSVLIGLTTMTISGIFVFMTFRIDRGARLKAQKTAQKIARKKAEEIANKAVKSAEEQAKIARNSAKEELKKVKKKVKKAIENVEKVANDAANQVKSNTSKKIDEIIKEQKKNATVAVREIADNEIKRHITEEYVRKQTDYLLDQIKSKKLVYEAVARAIKEMSCQELEELMEMIKQALKNRKQKPVPSQGFSKWFVNWFAKMFRRD